MSMLNIILAYILIGLALTAVVYYACVKPLAGAFGQIMPLDTIKELFALAKADADAEEGAEPSLNDEQNERLVTEMLERMNGISPSAMRIQMACIALYCLLFPVHAIAGGAIYIRFVLPKQAESAVNYIVS